MTQGAPPRKQRGSRAWVDLALSLLARGAGAPLAFAINILVARLLGPSDYGSYLSLLSAALLAGAVALFGVHRVTTRELATTPEALQRSALERLLGWSLRFAGRVTLVAMAVLLAWLIAGYGIVPTGWSEKSLVVFLVPLSAGTLLVAAILLGLGSTIGSQALNNAIKNAALLGGVLLLTVSARPASTALVILCQDVAYVFSIGVGLAWTLYLLRRLPAATRASANAPTPAAGAAPTATWQRSASYFFISSAAILALGRLDVVLVNVLSGATAAGLFGAANRLIQIAMIGGLVLMGWMQPRFGKALAHGNHDRVRTLWTNGTLLALALTALPAAAAWLAAPQLMGLMGNGFSAAIWPFRWLLMGTLFWGVCFPVGNALLTVTGQERILARTTWAQLGITVALVFALVPRFGALGGAVAYALGVTIASLILAMASWNAMRNAGDRSQPPAESSI